MERDRGWTLSERERTRGRERVVRPPRGQIRASREYGGGSGEEVEDKRESARRFVNPTRERECECGWKYEG